MTTDETWVESSYVLFSEITKSTLGPPWGATCTTGQTVGFIGHSRSLSNREADVTEKLDGTSHRSEQ